MNTIPRTGTATPHSRPKTVQFESGVRNIFFHILTACNLSCSHCYIKPSQHGKNVVSRQTMTTWLHLFYDPAKSNNLLFLGGEPTLHKDLAYGIREANSLGYDSVTVDTNGYCFHDILDRISPGDAVFSFSLDGPDAELNDAIRGRGSFDISMKNLNKAVSKGFSTSVIYTVSRRNVAYLHRMPDLLGKAGVSRFFIQVIGLRGKAATSADPLQLGRKEWLDIVPKVAEKAADMGITVIYPGVYLDNSEEFACAGIVSENYFLFPNGRVYRCPLCEDLPLHSLVIEGGRLKSVKGLTEKAFFSLNIPEGCVMNKLLQPGNIEYDRSGKPLFRISCCLLKQRVSPAAGS